MKTSIILAALLASVAITSARADTYRDLLDLSAKSLIAEDWREGLRHTRALLNLPGLTEGQRAEGLNHLCIALTQMGRVTHALRACNESIRLNGSDWGSYVNRGNALIAAGFRVSARADFRMAKKLNPEAEAVDVAESLQPETMYVFDRPSYGGTEQRAQGGQILAEP